MLVFVTRALTLLIALAGSGCTELGEYRGDYSGDVLGGVACAEDDEPCSFIRRGFRGATTLRLDGFDPTILDYDDATGTGPGRLTTDDEHCGAGTATLVDEPLRPVPALSHDALSQLEVPGSSRLRTYVYALEPSRGPLAGRDAMVFLTLLEEGDVEVRILAGDGAETDCAALPLTPAPPADCDLRSRQECDFFGVFELGGA